MMPQILGLASAREHLRVGGELSDDALREYVAAAEQIIAGHLGRPLICQIDGWAAPELVPANVVHAIKVVLTDIYDNRGAPTIDDGTLDRMIGRLKRVSVG
jgi:hypothetical protein